VDSTV
jgi:hypothetical protein